MADQYVDRRVQQVIRKANGDMAVAERLLQRLCEFDGELMRRLALPYLPGIISRTLSPSDRPRQRPKGKRSKVDKPVVRSRNAHKRTSNAAISDQALDAVIGQMAQQIGETKVPHGMTALVRPVEKSVCSPGHMKAVQALISSYERQGAE